MKHRPYTTQHTVQNKKLWVPLIFITIIATSGFWVSEHLSEGTLVVPKSVSSRSIDSAKAVPLPQKVKGTYLFTGTVMMGRAVETSSKGDYNQPFSGMDTLGTYDARVGVLECPITSNNVSYRTQVDRLLFNCPPAWLPTLKKYYPIVNVSSNHLNDMGTDGFNETVKRLNDAGFQVVGNYNPHVEKDDCKPVVLPVRTLKADGKEASASLPVVFCSFNYKTIFSPAPGELESIQKWSKIMPVIAEMNGGPEYEHQAGTAQSNVAHKMIDYGADFVVGNGTHWVQNTEVYKGKLIVYSMGNFIFDQLDYDGRIAFSLSVAMTLHYDDNVGKWLHVGESCTTNTVSCVEQANTPGLTRVMPSYTFDAIGSYGGFQQVATKANAQQQKDIESRANWPATKQLLPN